MSKQYVRRRNLYKLFGPFLDGSMQRSKLTTISGQEAFQRSSRSIHVDIEILSHGPLVYLALVVHSNILASQVNVPRPRNDLLNIP